MDVLRHPVQDICIELDGRVLADQVQGRIRDQVTQSFFAEEVENPFLVGRHRLESAPLRVLDVVDPSRSHLLLNVRDVLRASDVCEKPGEDALVAQGGPVVEPLRLLIHQECVAVILRDGGVQVVGGAQDELRRWGPSCSPCTCAACFRLEEGRGSGRGGFAVPSRCPPSRDSRAWSGDRPRSGSSRPQPMRLGARVVDDDSALLGIRRRVDDRWWSGPTGARGRPTASDSEWPESRAASRYAAHGPGQARCP